MKIFINYNFFPIFGGNQNEFAESDGRIVASFEVIFLLGWAPDASQQKPLPRGSAKHSLAEALGSKEYKTGDKATP